MSKYVTILFFIAFLHFGTPRPFKILLYEIIGKNDSPADIPMPIGVYNNPLIAKRDRGPWRFGKRSNWGNEFEPSDFENKLKTSNLENEIEPSDFENELETSNLENGFGSYNLGDRFGHFNVDEETENDY